MTDRPHNVTRSLPSSTPPLSHFSSIHLSASPSLSPPLHLPIPSPLHPPLSTFPLLPQLFCLSLPPSSHLSIPCISPSPSLSTFPPLHPCTPAPLHPCIPASPPASPHLSLRLISLRELCLRMSNALNRIIFLFQGKIIRSRTVGRFLKANVRSVDPVIPGEKERRAALRGKRLERRKRKGSVSSIFPISWENRSMQSPSAFQRGPRERCVVSEPLLFAQGCAMGEILPCCGRSCNGGSSFRKRTLRRGTYEIAPANQLVMLVGWVIAVPTTMANAPASMAALASSSVWMRPSQNTGTP